MRPIDADELLKKQTILNEYDEGGWDWPVSVVLVEDIKNAPTIDPESLRPSGRWLRLKYDSKWSKCSECKSNWEWEIIEYCNMLYCPNCGAKMEDGDGTQRKG